MYYNNNYYYGGNNLPQMNFSRVYPRVVVYGSNFNRRDGKAGEILREIPLSERDANYMLDNMSQHYKVVSPSNTSGLDPLDTALAQQARSTDKAIQRYKDAVKEVRKDLPGLSPEGRKILTRRFADNARFNQNSYNELLAKALRDVIG